MISRRTVLKSSALAAVAPLAPAASGRLSRAAAAPPSAPFVNPLPVPPVLDLRTGGAASLEMVDGVHDFFPGSRTPVFGYRPPGTVAARRGVLGPTIVAQRGVPVDLTMTNRLGSHPLAGALDREITGTQDGDAAAPRAVVHLHGGHTSSDNDGGPDDVIPNGGSFPYHYENAQQSAGLWYHDHALGITRLNVYAGLAGGYLVRDEDDDGQRLPSGRYEVPLIIQDRSFTLQPDGSSHLSYPAGPTRLWSPEFFGDVPTVNGAAWPTLEVERSKYRFRVYNGSQSRFYRMWLVSSNAAAVPFHQIGTDSGLLDAPAPLSKLVLGPGERADVVVDFAALPVGTTVRLANNAPTPFPDGPRPAHKGGLPIPTVMTFTVARPAGRDAYTRALPTPLRARPLTTLAGRPVAAVRTMVLLEVMDADDFPVMAIINDRPFHDHPGLTGDYRSITHRVDTLEQWNIVNLTGDAHPMHPHLVSGQILNRQAMDTAGYLAAHYPGLPMAGSQFASTYAADGVSPAPHPGRFLRGRPKPPPASERGWKDTYVAMPGEVTRILLPFGAGAVPGLPLAVDPPRDGPFTGDYVWHCHILEHEENDMMQRFQVR